ncbi:MAG TPA: DUF4872 domain-containing protein [Anaerolineales bacterium]|nr:DUF4872 domain-containing protein [Anaerolineales bacterium]
MKRIELPHKICACSCMINGLEDLYEYETGVRLPDWLLLHLSGLLGFVYIKNKNAPTPRMVFWGSNLAKYQYETLADLVGFQWHMVSNRSFPFTLERAKESVDRETPPILGVLDMYHLPYYDKFYHKIHVPIHHIMMVGYDDGQECVLVLDCDRSDAQRVSYVDLALAWNVNIPVLGKKNTFYTFEFNGQVADVEAIARDGLRKRANEMLEASISMLGLKGMRKLARELVLWPGELNPAQLEMCLRHLVEFTGFPPVPPSQLTGYSDAPDNHAAGRDIFADLLRKLALEYREPSWAEAGLHFDQSAGKLEDLTDAICDFILGKSTCLESAAALVAAVADIEEQGFRLLR